MAKVKLNQIERGNKTALVLNYTINGKRKQEATHLYLLFGKDKETKEVNKQTLKKAQELVLKKEIELAQEKVADKTPKLVDYYKTIFKRRKLSENFRWNTTIKWMETKDKLIAYLSSIGKNDMLVSDVTIGMIEGFKDYIRNNKRYGGKLTNVSINIYTNKLMCVLKQAVNEDYIKASVGNYKAMLKEERKEVDYLTTDEVKTLLSNTYRLRYIDLAVKVGLLSGFRVSDLMQLSWEHVKGDTIELTTIKTNYKAVIPISKPLAIVLNECKSVLNDDTLVLGDLKKNGSTNTRHLKAYLNQCGISNKGRGWHILRHTYSVELLNSGISPYIVSKLLTHTNISTLKHYENVKVDSLKDAIKSVFG